MLDDVRPLLASKKVNDLTGRMNDNKRPEQLVAAEMELALLWGIKQVSDLEIEPAIPNSSRVPEAYSPTFFCVPSYIEVATVSDGKLSGEANMRRATQKIVEFANSCRRKSGNNLHFSFGEKSSWVGNRYFREHHVAPDFELAESMKADMRSWVNSAEFEKTSLRLQSERITVTITSRQYRQKPGFNFFSSLPPLAYDIEDNPLYATLEDKYKQLSGIPSSALKVIFLADGGSRLLRHLTDKDMHGQHKSGAEIIEHFLKRRDIDLVCVFSPQRRNSSLHRRDSLQWKISCFEGSGKRISSYESLERLSRALPTPRFEGYQARSIQKQAGFSPTARGWYLGTKIGSGRGRVTVKMSARLLQEFMAGRITPERFKDHVSGDNLFEKWLDAGYVISDVRFESAGVDEDDDRVVFEFNCDPAAARFR